MRINDGLSVEHSGLELSDSAEGEDYGRMDERARHGRP